MVFLFFVTTVAPTLFELSCTSISVSIRAKAATSTHMSAATGIFVGCDGSEVKMRVLRSQSALMKDQHLH
jgi:hypothetical protein